MNLRSLVAAVLALLTVGRPAFACYDQTFGAQRRFVLNGGEAFDSKTGLSWRRCSVGTEWDGKRGCRGEKTFASLPVALKYAMAEGGQWRVPSGPELESIIDLSCGNSVVDRSVFPDIVADEDGAADYWTTSEVGAAGLVYFFDFVTGRADGHSRGYELAVRLVRTGH
jgi:Protein of unknown function (DUF1566)